MSDIQAEIEELHLETQKASAILAKALRDRKATNKDSPLVVDLNAAVVAAKQALNAVEVKLRKLYESKEDE
jgi:hypothetical protein